MAGGAIWRRAPRDDEPVAEQAALPLGDTEWLADAAEEPERGPHWSEWILPGAMALLAIAWIGTLAMLLLSAAPAGGLGPMRLAAWVGVGSGPLTLLGLLALVMLRTGRAEATRYARAARDLRMESIRLAELLTLVDRRIATARQGLAKHGMELVRMGEETSDRLGRAGEALRGDMALVAETAAKLDDATATARTDMGVLLTDLPTLETKATRLSETLRAIGEDAENHGQALAASLAGIEAQAKAADQGSVAAARRLAIELERIEGSAAAADRRITEAASKLGDTADAVLATAAQALDQVRRGIGDQSAALMALAGQARDALGRSGDEQHRLLANRLDQLSLRIEETSGRIASHESAARGLLGQLDMALGGVEARFEGLGDKGAEHVADLAETLAALAEHGEQIGRLLGQNNSTAETMLGRVGALREQVEIAVGQLGVELPEALSGLRERADMTLALLKEASPRTRDLVDAAETLQAKLAEGAALAELGSDRVAQAIAEADERMRGLQEQADDRIANLQDQADERMAKLQAQADARFTGLQEQIATLEGLVARTDGEIAALAEGASVRLVDALLRVRETAAQAAAHARETLASAVPAAAAELAKASAEAMAGALQGVGRIEIEAVRTASTEAADAASAAGERLTRQLMTLTETTRSVEARITEHNKAAADSDEQNFSRQVALLIEALNSSAIDVAKILSNEPTDTEWAAYLKGDRGVFTRRAVRLVEAGDLRAITGRYNDDSEFRTQVNRYIHDFESMLRRVLAVREGAAMGVTMLSSDMGKLYVALAQAIERLRK